MAGYRAMAITDHADHSNFDFILSRVSKVCGKLSEAYGLFVLPGIEITHVPPRWIPALAKESRKAGAKIIVVHGETLVEPVMEGTNLAAVQSDIDILAHPGLIDEDSVRLAEKAGICLEISARKGHCLGNGHVAAHGPETRRQAGDQHGYALAGRSRHPLSLHDALPAAQGFRNAETARLFKNAEEIVHKVISARETVRRPRKKG